MMGEGVDGFEEGCNYNWRGVCDKLCGTTICARDFLFRYDLERSNVDTMLIGECGDWVLS